MRFNYLKATLRTTAVAVLVLLLGASWAVAQQQVKPDRGTDQHYLPDGTVVPMWGYTCGAAVSGSTAACAALHPTALGWSPVVITVPTGQTLVISLTNSLTFGANSVPTSLTIVGQLGGGLGATPDPHSESRSTLCKAPHGRPRTPPQRILRHPRSNACSRSPRKWQRERWRQV